MTKGRPSGSKNKVKTVSKKLTEYTKRPTHQPNVTMATRELRSTQKDIPGEPVIDLEKSFDEAVNKAVAKFTTELGSLKLDFIRSIEDHELRITELEKKNDALTKAQAERDDEIDSLQKAIKDLTMNTNKLERFSRRSNLRIIGLPSIDKEDCLKMATDVFRKVGVENCCLERAHRDGKLVPGRPRHLLVKLSFYRDKITILKGARKALENDNFYIADDLTQVDLKEKRKWKDQVSNLYGRGVRLRFSGGLWRDRHGKPFVF